MDPYQIEENTSYTHSEVRAPLYTPSAPTIQIASNLAQDLAGEGNSSSALKVTSTTNEKVIGESSFLSEQAREDEEKRQRELARIEAKTAKELEKQTEKYRKEAEEQAEKIRKELEKQHAKDIEFRKKVVDQTIEKQKKEIDVEEKFALKELEREQKLAENVLEQSKLTSTAEVRLGSAVGTTVSSGEVVSEKVVVVAQDQPKSYGERIKDWLLGKS